MTNKLSFRWAALLLLSLLFQLDGYGQNLKGIVYELESSNPLWNVTIKNLRTQQETLTDREGKFDMAIQLNDYLTFTMPGYQTDTAFIYELGVRRIYMLRDEHSIVLDEVFIKRLTDSRLASEIEKAKLEGKSVDVSKHRGGIRISPSRLFGRKAKGARNNLSMLVQEQANRQVDKFFTTKLITSVVDLSQDEVAVFKDSYRPTLDFVQKASPEDLRLYILDSYKKFKGH